ncbi:response regulator transcription factor [Agarilytica rhodophyticola]|uniref:response regulator transcription factor n=1 Tax=Agarilytica rhodophyticola TaxID=1737490 RepID=UPI000B3411B7|nr:response regulator transcription factor [Agarilytica rhodophyticola]
MKVLVVEDDGEVSSFIRSGLEQAAYTVDVCTCGKSGLLQASSENYDVIILDRMLPGVDGIAVTTTLRTTGVNTPILILSALGEVSHRVEGLKAGADDYLTKPFAFSELQVRLEVLSRRKRDPVKQCTELYCHDLRLNLLTHDAIRAGKIIKLQPREYRLLEYLLRHQKQVVTRTMLLENVWDYHFHPQTNIIDVHISRLRNKIDKPFENHLIHTIRGYGYVLGPDKKVS